MESMSTNKNVFTKQLLIEKKRDYFKIQLDKIMEKWKENAVINFSLMRNADLYPIAIPISIPEIEDIHEHIQTIPEIEDIQLPEDDDDELDIF